MWMDLAARESAPMTPNPSTQPTTPNRSRRIARRAISTSKRCERSTRKLEYLVGGGYAMAHYTGIARNTKDLDIFIRPATAIAA
jgi:hypothetical protein